MRKRKPSIRALTAARKAGVPIPFGELPGERPDFRFNENMSGVDITELLNQRAFANVPALLFASAFAAINTRGKCALSSRSTGPSKMAGIRKSLIGCPSPAIHDSGESLNLLSSIGMRA